MQTRYTANDLKTRLVTQVEVCLNTEMVSSAVFCSLSQECGARFKSSVTGSSWCNGPALAWSLVSRRSANWGLSGVSGEKHLRPLCYHHPKMELSLVRIIRKQESPFSSIQHSLMGVYVQPLVTVISWFYLCMWL